MCGKSIRFSYGALGKELELQANEQGFTLGNEAEKLEKIKKAIIMCKFHVATETQSKSMNEKLHKKVMKALNPILIKSEEE